MGKRNSFWPSRKKRNAAQQIMMVQDWDDISLPYGYTSLAKNPEVQSAVNAIAGLIASMTIYLMKNTKKGDIREKNELAKKVDIDPYKYMTRHNWMFYIVKNMLIDGNQIILPTFADGKLENLKPLNPSEVFIRESNTDDDYYIEYRGKHFAPDEVLHFSLNPSKERPYKGMGFTVNLNEVVKGLGQAQKTKTAFMSSKWKPSLIVRVDGVSSEFKSKEGRAKLLDDYFHTNEAGQPWVIPAEQFEVSQVKPLSLNDLAIADSVQLDRKTVASVLGVPPYIVGAGDFNRDEYNNFIGTKVMQIAQVIQQTLTAGLLYSPNYYFRFNFRSLLDYSLADKVQMYAQMADRMAVDRNEFRDGLGMDPREDMDELLGLENYIPANMLGKQKKLKAKEESKGV